MQPTCVLAVRMQCCKKEICLKCVQQCSGVNRDTQGYPTQDISKSTFGRCTLCRCQGFRCQGGTSCNTTRGCLPDQFTENDRQVVVQNRSAVMTAIQQRDINASDRAEDWELTQLEMFQYELLEIQGDMFDNYNDYPIVCDTTELDKEALKDVHSRLSDIWQKQHVRYVMSSPLLIELERAMCEYNSFIVDIGDKDDVQYYLYRNQERFFTDLLVPNRFRGSVTPLFERVASTLDQFKRGRDRKIKRKIRREEEKKQQEQQQQQQQQPQPPQPQPQPPQPQGNLLGRRRPLPPKREQPHREAKRPRRQ